MMRSIRRALVAIGARPDQPQSAALPPDVVRNELIADPERAARIAFAALFVVASVLTLAVIWPFWSPLVLAAVLASAMYGVYERITRWFGGRRSAGAAASTIGLLLVIIGPIGAIVGFVAGQILQGVTFLNVRLGIHSMEQLQRSGFSPRGRALVDRALVAMHVSRGQLEDWMSRAAAYAEQGAARVLEHSSTAIINTSIMLIAFYFFLLEGRRLIRWLWLVSPLQARQTRDLLEEFREVSRATVLGASLAALFQGIVATIGYLLAGVPSPFFFGVLTLVTSFVPVVGTMLVWVPAVILLWLFGSHAAALLLLGWCIVFVVGAENVGKPMMLRAILGGEHDMHAGIVFLSLLGGIEMFGVIGVVLGPLIFAFFLAMVRIYERDFLFIQEVRRGLPAGPASLEERAP